MSVPRDRLLGFALAAGGMTAHSSILARSLGIPAVVGLGDSLLDTVQGTETLALDGGAGILLVNPPEHELQRLRDLVAQQRAERDVLRTEVDRPSVTGDGVMIGLLANAANAADASAAQEWGAAGIGLLRTELLFLERSALPDEEEQLALYQAVAAALPNQPITVRTLDVGGDKPMPALALPREANPFLGWRGLRIGLDRPETLLPQLRALLRAGANADIRIMLPMVTSVAEFRRARALLDEARRQLADAGLPCADTPQLGMMVEVPAAALNAAAFAREADFFSIGTNDLTQYTLACDRGNERVSGLYQPLHPAVLRLIAMTCEAAHAYGRHVAVCGDLAGDARATPLLIGLGVDELSCAAGQIALVRRAIRATDTTAARELAARALACAAAEEVHALLSA